MFDNLQDKMDRVFKTLRGEASLNEWHIDNALKEIRVALLEADVHFKVVKEFTNRVREKAVGENVLTAFSPAQQVTKIVRDELQQLLGGNEVGLALVGSPAVVMMAGLQGSGKTTTSGKLALHLRNRGKRPMLVPCDVYRPAAIEQLRIVANGVKVPFFELGEDRNPLSIAKRAVQDAKTLLHDVVILDTAVRLHIEKVETEIDRKEAEKLAHRVAKDKFTLEDLRAQLQQVKKMGPLSSLVSMIPGAGKINEEDIDEKAVVRMQAILDSMTKKERDFPQIIDGKRKKRIAKGSGTTVQEINRLLKQYLQMKKMMRSFSKGFGARKFGKMMKGLPPEFMQ